MRQVRWNGSSQWSHCWMLSSILLHPKQSAVLGRFRSSSGDSYPGEFGMSNCSKTGVAKPVASVFGPEACDFSESKGEAVGSKLSVGAIPVVKSSNASLGAVVTCEMCRVSEFVKIDAMSDTLVSASVIVVAEEAILLLTTSQSFKMFSLLESIFRVTVVKASDDVCAACSLIESLDVVMVCVRRLTTSSIVSRSVAVVGVSSKVVIINSTLPSMVANRCVRCSMVCIARFHCPEGICTISECGGGGGDICDVIGVCNGVSLSGLELGADCCTV